MRKTQTTRTSDDVLAEYAFGGGVRGKYSRRYAEGTHVVVLAPDAHSVNRTLRRVQVPRRRKAT